MFYEQEKKYKTLEELKEAIEDYIYYYNNKRIKEKLKGLTPASYRSQSLLVSWINLSNFLGSVHISNQYL